MSFSRTEIVRRLRRLFRQAEFQVSKRFALSTREDRVFFVLVPTVGLLAGGLAVIVQRLTEGLRVLLWGYYADLRVRRPGGALRAGGSCSRSVTGGLLVAILSSGWRGPPSRTQGVSSPGRGGGAPRRAAVGAAGALLGGGGDRHRRLRRLARARGADAAAGRRGLLLARAEPRAVVPPAQDPRSAAAPRPASRPRTTCRSAARCSRWRSSSGSFALEIFGPIVVAAVLATLLVARRARARRRSTPRRATRSPAPGRSSSTSASGWSAPWRRSLFVLGVRLLRPPLPQRRGRAGWAAAGGRARRCSRPRLRLAGGARATASSTITAALREELPPGGSWRSSPAEAHRHRAHRRQRWPGRPLHAVALLRRPGRRRLRRARPRAFPHATALVGAYAAVGMAAVAAGSSHAPLSAILILFEFTGNYDLILPLMIASIVSSMVAKRALSVLDLHRAARAARRRALVADGGGGARRPRGRGPGARRPRDAPARRRPTPRWSTASSPPTASASSSSTPSGKLLGSSRCTTSSTRCATPSRSRLHGWRTT